MKVLFISRATLFSVRGGDTVQVENTAECLRKLGVAVDIELCDNNHMDYSSYDLIHFFNIIRPADILYHIRRSSLPFVVSPIYVEYEAAARNNKAGWRRRLLALLGRHFREYIKVIGRAVKNGERIMSPLYLLWGHNRSIRYILSHCSYLLPNSHSEYKRLQRDFREAGAYSVVPNAVDTSIFHADETGQIKQEENTILCVARIEPQKNQLAIIRALKDTSYKISFVGNMAPNHKAYYEACIALAKENKNISFTSFIGQEEVAQLYRRHKVHILASWFETTGLSSLEAIACGCNIVISDKGDTVEYFGTHAFYCDPGDPDSIRVAVTQAMQAPIDEAFMQHIKENNNWEVTARETLSVYQKVLHA